MNKNNNPSLSKTKSKLNIVTTTAIIIALILLIAVNLIVEAIPKNKTQIDISANKIYTLSSTTTDYLKTINEKITIYYICAGGIEDAELTPFLNRYDNINSNINIVKTDPLQDETFLDNYTSDTIDNYSLIVESSQRYKVIAYSDMNYYYSEEYNDQFGKISTDQYDQYLSYYGDTFADYFFHYFSGEAALTGAIEYVLGDVKAVYTLTGHSEADASDNITYILTNTNIVNATLNLKTSNAIPNDATAIFINAPQTDITQNELSLLRDFTSGGGDILLLTSKDYLELPNLLSLMSDCGLSAKADTVCDATSYFDSTTNTLVAQLNTVHEIVSTLGTDYSVYLQNAHGIEIAETVPTNWSISELFYTTDTGYYANTPDVKEKITVGAIAENSATGSDIVWISSSAFLNDTFSNFQYYGNSYYFLTSLLYFGNVVFKTSLSTISPIQLDARTLSVSDASANFWTTIFIFIIPLTFVVVGIIIAVKRKHR